MNEFQYQAFGVFVGCDQRSVSERATRTAELMQAVRAQRRQRQRLRRLRRQEAYTTAV